VNDKQTNHTPFDIVYRCEDCVVSDADVSGAPHWFCCSAVDIDRVDAPAPCPKIKQNRCYNWTQHSVTRWDKVKLAFKGWNQ